jgi:hypothetical protein
MRALGKEKIRRMCVVFSILSNQVKPTSKDSIIDRVYDMTGSEYCASTVEKTLFDLRMDFDINVKYSKTQKGYYIGECEDGEHCQITFISGLFEYLKLAELKIVKECLILMKKEQ